MNDNYTIYKFTFSDGKIYIGQTSKPVEERWKNGEGYKGQDVYVPITLEGWDSIKKEILHTDLTAEQANQLEKHYIQKFNSIKNGYNKNSGGNNSIPKIKNIYIDNSSIQGQNFNINQKIYFYANSRLNHSGMTVYMYLLSIAPHSYNRKTNTSRLSYEPFPMSTSIAAQVVHKDQKTIQRGINNLIETGYLIPRNNNVYQFIDILTEDLAKIKDDKFDPDFITFM